MNEFIQAVRENPFLQYALIGAVLSSVACGVVGSYVVSRRITYIAGGISHCVLGGIGAAVYLQRVMEWSWCTPTVGAIVAALISAAIIGGVTIRAKEREDTVVGALWAVGMAIGVLFISRTPGYAQDLTSYLFGNILMVTPSDVWMIGIVDVVVVAVCVWFHHRLQAVCFDEEFAEIRGVAVRRYYLLLLVMTAMTVVLLSMVVGVVMVIALLTLPVAVAGRFAKSMVQMMILGTMFSVAFTTSGLMASYGPELPAGATIILLAAAVYLVIVIGETVWRKISGSHHVPAPHHAHACGGGCSCECGSQDEQSR